MPEFKIPSFNPTDWRLVGSVLIMILILGFVALVFRPQIENPQFTANEAPLVKNVNLQILPGEIYTYMYTMGNTSDNLTYIVLYGGNCTVVQLLGGGQQDASVCLDEWGNDATGQNASYGVPAIILTRPWMLALQDGWSWNVSNYMMFDSWAQHIVDTNYTVVREEYYEGREAYVVKMQSSQGDVAMDWVDADKRILLREVGQNYEIVLTDGLPMSPSPS